MDPKSRCIEFNNFIKSLFDKILDESWGAIDQAAGLFADAIARDALIHTVGAGGHAQIPCMDLFYRAGGLANVSIMFPPGLGLFDGKPCLERIAGMGAPTMSYHDVRKEDVVLIVNFYGMNAATIDLALAAKERAAAVIGMTNSHFSRATPPDFPARHPTKLNLCDIADVTIELHTPVDEQIVSVPGVREKVGVASSIASCHVAQLLAIRACEIAVARGITPPVYRSCNLPGGDEENDGYLKKYMPLMRHLYPVDHHWTGA